MATKKVVYVDDDVREILTGMTWWEEDGRVVGKVEEQLDRSMYLKVNRVLEKLDGKWDRKRGGHVFPAGEDPREPLGMLEDEDKIVVDHESFFVTPPAVVRKMIEQVDLDDVSDLILEPSAGEGHICDVLVEKGVPQRHIHVVELNEARRKVLREKGYKVVGINFEWFVPEVRYSGVFMNPPFEKKQDLQHVARAFQLCLEPGGTLVAVTADGWAWGSTKKDQTFRDLVARVGYDVQLPSGSFSESGTNVETRLVVLKKPARDAEERDDYGDLPLLC